MYSEEIPAEIGIVIDRRNKHPVRATPPPPPKALPQTANGVQSAALKVKFQDLDPQPSEQPINLEFIDIETSNEVCPCAFYELNALVADFVCAYKRMQAASTVENGHTVGARVNTKRLASPGAIPRKSPSALENVAQCSDMPERETSAKLSFQMSGTTGDTSEVLSPVLTETQLAKPKNKTLRSMSRTLDALLAEEAFKRRKSSIIVQEAGGFFRTYWSQLWAWCTESPGEEVVMKTVEPVMGVLIVTNCILIAVSFDTEAWGGWYAVDCVFASLFVIEMAIRLKLIGWREMFLGYAWRVSVFDTAIVVLAIVDLFIQASGSITMFRILRLVRLTRLMRVMRLQFFREVVMLVRGMAGGTRCLLWSMFFLTMPVFFVGMMMSQVLKDWGDDGLFSSVPIAMFTTFRCMCADCTDHRGRPIFSLIAKSHGWYFALFYSIFILVTSIGLFNLITALFIEVTMQAAKSDTVLQSQKRKADDRRFAKNVKELVFQIRICVESRKVGRMSTNVRASGAFFRDFARFTVSDALDLVLDESFYQELVRTPHIQEILEDMGLNHDDMVNLFDMLDVDRNGKLDLTELVNGLHMLRGEAKKSDLVALSYIVCSIRDSTLEINARVTQLCEAQGLR